MFEVVVKFKDKNTKEIFEVGSEYKSKSKKRLKELEDGGYIKKEENPEPLEPEQDKADDKAERPKKK